MLNLAYNIHQLKVTFKMTDIIVKKLGQFAWIEIKRLSGMTSLGLVESSFTTRPDRGESRILQRKFNPQQLGIHQQS